MTSIQETEIEGNPAAIESLASFVRATLASGVSSLAQDVGTARSNSLSAWSGEAATAFRARLVTAKTAIEGLQDQLGDIATWLEELADALTEAQSGMTSARNHARQSGLIVTGTKIHHPPLPQLSTTASAEHTAAVSATHANRVAAWNSSVNTAATSFTTWGVALQLFEGRCAGLSGSLASLFTDLLTGTLQTGALSATAYNLSQLRNFHLENAAKLTAHVDHLTAGGIARSTPQHIYQLMDDARASNALANAKNVQLKDGLRVGSRLGRGLHVLGAAATGYAIYDDIQQGESATQAVASNVGGMAAGMGAGLATGAIVGSFILPPAGTIVGAAVGTVVGAGVGMFTSGAIDHLFENASAGFASTVEAGWNEVTDTLSDVGDLAKGAWNSLFG